MNTDIRYLYALSVGYYHELFERFRFTLSHLLKSNTSDKNEIEKIINSKSFEKNKLLQNKIKEILKNSVLIGEEKVTPFEKPSTRNICHNLQECTTDPYCKSNSDMCLLYVEKSDYPKIIWKLVLDIQTSDDILKGKIRQEFLDKDNFAQRSSDVILLSPSEIKKFFTE